MFQVMNLKFNKENILKVALLLPIAAAVSIILEILDWQRLTARYETHVFTNHLSQWIGKHLLIGAIISLVITALTSVSLGKERKNILFVSLVIGVTFLTQLGFASIWFCPNGCESVAILVAPITIGIAVFFSVIALIVLLVLAKKLPKILLLLLALISVVAIAFAINRVVQQNQIVANYPFVTQSLDKTFTTLNRPSPFAKTIIEQYRASHRDDIEGKNINQWQEACAEYDRLSYGFTFYGKAAAINCYIKGAVMYRSADLCQAVPAYGDEEKGLIQSQAQCLELVAKLEK